MLKAFGFPKAFFYSLLIMIKTILSGYKKLLTSVLKIFLLFSLCFLLGFVIVWPLWYFASKNAHLYTLCTIIAAAVVTAYQLFKLLGKTKPRAILDFLLQALILIAGLFFCIFFIFQSQRLIALCVLILTFVLFGFFKFGMHSK